MPTKLEEIELRSDEVQEVLSNPPHWIILRGNAVFLSIIIVLLAVCCLIKYPDIISTEAIITTRIPPHKEFAVISSKFDSIYVKDSQTVSKDDVLAILENTANTKDVFYLKSILDTMEIKEESLYFPVEDLPVLFLGEIDENYAFFQNSYTNYILNNQLKPFKNESLANRVSVTELRGRLANLKAQYRLNESEFSLKKNELDRNKQLFIKGVVSTQEFENKKQEVLVAERNFEKLKVSISQIREAIVNANRDLKETEIRKAIEEQQLLKTTIQSIIQLKRAIKDWENTYVFKSEIEGKVIFLNYWNENQTVTQGDLVFSIIPTENLNYIAKVKAQSQNSGKIKVGQKVNVSLQEFPESEFGFLLGSVERISLTADKEGFYHIDVSLPKNLVTSYNKKILFKQEMRGNAEIVTEDLRLVERFFYQFKELLNR